VSAGGIIASVVDDGLVTRYSFALTLGVAAGLLWLSLARRGPAASEGPKPGSVPLSQGIDAGIASLAGGLVGARLTFVLVHSGYYLRRPLESMSFWEGGLSWLGAAAGAVLGLMVYSRLVKTSPWLVADMLAIPAMWVAASAWIGCRLEGCAYGFRVEPAWWALRAPDWTGDVALRWPTQLVGSLLCLLGIPGLLRIEKRPRRAGTAACLSLAFISAVSSVLSLTRGDPIWLVFGVRLDTLASIAILLPSLAFLAWHMEKDRIGRTGCPASL